MKANKMKKNMLFSIALCIGLMLPGISFGSEPTQSTYDWIKEKINSWYKYSTQAQELPTTKMSMEDFAHLGIAAAGAGLVYFLAAYSEKNAKRKPSEVYIDPGAVAVADGSQEDINWTIANNDLISLMTTDWATSPQGQQYRIDRSWNYWTKDQRQNILIRLSAQGLLSEDDIVSWQGRLDEHNDQVPKTNFVVTGG